MIIYQIKPVEQQQAQEHVTIPFAAEQQIRGMCNGMGIDPNTVLQTMRNTTIDRTNGFYLNFNRMLNGTREDAFAQSLTRAVYDVTTQADRTGTHTTGSAAAMFNADIYARALANFHGLNAPVNSHLSQTVTFDRLTLLEINREGRHIGLTQPQEQEALQAAIRVYTQTRSVAGEEVAEATLRRTNFSVDESHVNPDRIRQLATMIGRRIGPQQTIPDLSPQGVAGHRFEITMTREQVHEAKRDFMQAYIREARIARITGQLDQDLADVELRRSVARMASNEATIFDRRS